MMPLTRRSLLSAMGVALPFVPGVRSHAAATSAGPGPALQLVSFEEAVRVAFADHPPTDDAGPHSSPRRIEVGHSEVVQAGVQGCHNDRPFAGFPAGHLRIVRTGSGPGPVFQGVRLHVTTVDVVLTGGRAREVPSRPLDFASLPSAPTFS